MAQNHTNSAGHPLDVKLYFRQQLKDTKQGYQDNDNAEL